MPLDYNNSIPLYIQLKKEIEEKIIRGKFKDRIPSEREIMDEYYVSRSTVRQAIDELVKEGILEKRPGKGTFVSRKHINDWLGSLSSTTETIQRMGMEPGAALVETKIVSLSEQLQDITGLNEAYFIKRIRYANNIPIGIESHYYPISLGKKIIGFDLNKVTLYDLLENHFGIHTLQADQVIRADKVSEEDAKLLRIDTDDSILIADRKLLDIEGNFVEFEHARYRADMYSFRIKLSRKNG